MRKKTLLPSSPKLQSPAKTPLNGKRRRRQVPSGFEKSKNTRVDSTSRGKPPLWISLPFLGEVVGKCQNVLSGALSVPFLSTTTSAIIVACCVLMAKSEASRRAIWFWRHAGPIVAHYKLTQAWLIITRAPVEKRHTVYGRLHDRYCQPWLDIILHLQGLYVKIGQILSSRPDFVPEQYVRLCSTVQDQVPQWPISKAEAVIRDSLKREHGLELEDVFESIDPVVLGSASIGQVHKAVLKDAWVDADCPSGREVALKVMHPDSKARFRWDFQVFRWLARIALPSWLPFLHELETRMMTEFNYWNEADSLSEVRNNIQKSRYAGEVCIPKPHPSLCSQEVLVMELFDGKKLIDIIEDRLTWALGGDREKSAGIVAKKKKDLLLGVTDSAILDGHTVGDIYRESGVAGVWRAIRGVSLVMKMREYIDLLVEVHGHQIFIDGCFNGDPHPGNVMVLSDGRLGLIDYGSTRRITDKERLDLARIVKAIYNKKGEEEIASAMRRAGFRIRSDRNDVMVQYAIIIFDTDIQSKRLGYSTPQHYFADLMAKDPLVTVPDASILVCRMSFLFRGAGTMLNHPIKTASHWGKHANQALRWTQDEDDGITP